MMYAPRHRSRRYRARAPITMGIGGIIAFSLSAFVGWWGADTLHRWSETLSATDAVPAGFSDAATYNAMVVDAKPHWKSVAWQAALSVGAFALGGFVRPSWAKLLFFGAGVGSTVHLVNQLATHYIILPLLGKTAWGMRAYAHEIQVDNAIYPPAAGTTQGLGAPPGRPAVRQAPPVRALPQGQVARMPQPIATGARPLAGVAFPAGTAAAPFGMGQQGTSAPPVTVPNNPDGSCPDGTTTVQNPSNWDMPYCVPPAISTPPPGTFTNPTPPPATSTPPPATSMPTPPPPMTAQTPPVTFTPPSGGPPAYTSPPAPPPSGCAPCGPTVMQQAQAALAAFPGQPLPPAPAAPCCGSSPCSCGCQVAGNTTGAPPPPADGPVHPMFRNALTLTRRRAA